MQRNKIFSKVVQINRWNPLDPKKVSILSMKSTNRVQKIQFNLEIIKIINLLKKIRSNPSRKPSFLITKHLTSLSDPRLVPFP
jgi:hypothetical protein